MITKESLRNIVRELRNAGIFRPRIIGHVVKEDVPEILKFAGFLGAHEYQKVGTEPNEIGAWSEYRFIEIKPAPCPYCGGDAKEERARAHGVFGPHSIRYIYCQKCSASAGKIDWERRVARPPI